jgi:hypothetical protein
MVLHFLPSYRPHLDPIERLWGLMHENLTHNRDYKTFAEFRGEILKFLRHIAPRGWKHFCDRNDGQLSRDPSRRISASLLAGVIISPPSLAMATLQPNGIESVLAESSLRHDCGQSWPGPS